MSDIETNINYLELQNSLKNQCGETSFSLIAYYILLQIIIVLISFIATKCSSSNTADQNLNIMIRGPTKEGVVQSPNFPNPFPANIHCKWYFTAPIGHNVKVFMATINIDTKNQCYLKSELSLYDENKNPDGLLSKTYCRYFTSTDRLRPSFHVLSSGAKLMMEFKSGSDAPSGYGFNANYTFQSLGK